MKEVLKMMMFILGMLVMYLIVGIIVALDEIFGQGFLDEWFVYLFCWWQYPILAPIGLIIKIYRKRKNNKKSIDKYKIK